MWTKLDDGLQTHRKLLRAARLIKGPDGHLRALGAFCTALLYANRYLTDGHVPQEAFDDVGASPKAVEALVAAGFLDVADERGGYQIHDFADWNQTAATVRERQAWDRERKALYADRDLIDSIRARDQDRCRYCGRAVNWHDRRGEAGGQFDHVIPRGGNTYENVVVACRGCNTKKGQRTPQQAGLVLLYAKEEPNPNQEPGQIGFSSDLVPLSSSRARTDARLPSRPVPTSPLEEPPYPPPSGGRRITRAVRQAALRAQGPPAASWRDRCHHVPTCGTPEECQLKTARGIA